MFAKVMMLRNVDWNAGLGSPQERAAEGKAGDVFKNIGVFDSGGGVFTPGEGGVAGDKDAGDGDGVEIVFAEVLDNDGTGVADVGFGDFLGGEGARNGNGAVKVVGVGGAEAGNRAAGLRPGGSELGVGVNDAADLGKLAVEQGVGVEVAGGIQGAFDDLAVEIGDDEIGRLEGGVIDTAGLDDDEGLPPGPVKTHSFHAAGVSKGVGRQAAAGYLLVGVKDLFAERFEQHDVFFLS
jgi:hypothetical protein